MTIHYIKFQVCIPDPNSNHPVHISGHFSGCIFAIANDISIMHIYKDLHIHLINEYVGTTQSIPICKTKKSICVVLCVIPPDFSICIKMMKTRRELNHETSSPRCSHDRSHPHELNEPLPIGPLAKPAPLHRLPVDICHGSMVPKQLQGA